MQKQKLTDDQVIEIYRRAWLGERTCHLATEFSVTRALISRIKHGNANRRIRYMNVVTADPII